MVELPVNVIVLSMCLLLAVFVIVLLFIKNTFSKKLSVLGTNNNSLQPVPTSTLDDSKSRTQMVLKNHFSDVPFDVAFKQNGLSEVIVRNSMEPVEAMFHELLPNAPSGVRIVESITKKDNRLIFDLSEAGKKLLQTGQAEIMKTKDGAKWLPQIRNVENKQIIELFKAKDISKLSSVAKNVTKLANVAVGVANIISNIDMVKKLEVLDKKVDFLIAGRHLDKKSELESCYKLVSEIRLICGTNDCEDKLYDIHTKLTNLRVTWKNECEYKLNTIKNPYEKGFAKYLKEHKKIPRILLGEGSKDKTINSTLAEVKELLFLRDFAALFDFALCSAINHPILLEDDIRNIDLLIEDFKKKTSYLSDKSKDPSLEKHLSYLNHFKQKYQYLLDKKDNIELHAVDDDQSLLEGQYSMIETTEAASMTDYEKNKAIVKQSTEAIKTYLSSITVGIYIINRQGNPEDLGSGTCIEVNNRWFIATAGHVIQSNIENIRILPHIGNSNEENRIRILSKEFINDGHNDWGWLELDKTEKDKLQGSFIGLNNIMVNQYHFEDDLIIVNGFPNNWTKVQQPYIAFKPIVYNTITTSPAKWPLSLGYITDRDIIYEYPKEGNFETAANGMINTPPAHGISGGGVWKTNINIQGKVWSTDQIKLIGIQIGKPKDYDVLHGIQILNWLKFLGKYDADIANNIAKYFPDKQVSSH